MATKKKATKKKPAAKKPTPKVAQPNKTARVLDYHKANPDVKPKEMSEALAKDGIEVSAAYVSTILHKAKKSTETKKPATKKPAAKSFEKDISVDPRALEYAKAMGGIEQAKEALDRLKRVKDQLEDV